MVADTRPAPAYQLLVRWFAHRPRRAMMLFLLLLLAMALAAVWRSDQQPVNTDILAMVASAQDDPVRAAAKQRLNGEASSRQTWRVSHSSREQAFAAAQLVQAGLAANPLYRVDTAGAAAGADIEQFYRDHQFGLADTASLALAEAKEPQLFVDRVLRQLYATFSIPGDTLARDPLLLAEGFQRELLRVPPPFALDRGLLVAQLDGAWTYLVPARLAGEAFDLAFQQDLTLARDALRRQVQASTGATVQPLGVVDFAIANRARGTAEALTIGLVSLVLVTLLFLLTFGDARPYGAVLFAIVMGLAAGILGCLILFGSVHVLTFVAGSTLIGISVDYAFHLLAGGACRRAGPWHLADELCLVLPEIVLGLTTSLLGFAGLFASGFRGLQEIALFSASGLVTVVLALVLAFPLLLGGWQPRSRTEPLLARLARRWDQVSGRGGMRVLFAAAGVTALVALLAPPLTFDNNVRLLAADTPELQRLYASSGQLAGTLMASQYIVVSAPTVELLLRQEEQLRPTLERLRSAGSIAGFWQLSQVLPSRQRQQEVRALNRQLLFGPDSALAILARDIGLTGATVQAIRADFSRSAEDLLTLDTWLQSPAATLGNNHWLGTIDGQAASLMTLAGVTDVAAVAAALPANSGARLIDSVADVNAVFARYVNAALTGLAAAFVLISVLVALRFGLVDGALVMLAPILSGTLTLSLLALLGESINLFHIVGGTLILGIGLDYTLFLKAGRTRGHAVLAVTMAAITTEVAFGLLTFSAMGAIHSFGLTVALGTAASFVMAPIVVNRKQEVMS